MNTYWLEISVANILMMSIASAFVLTVIFIFVGRIMGNHITPFDIFNIGIMVFLASYILFFVIHHKAVLNERNSEHHAKIISDAKRVVCSITYNEKFIFDEGTFEVKKVDENSFYIVSKKTGKAFRISDCDPLKEKP